VALEKEEIRLDLLKWTKTTKVKPILSILKIKSKNNKKRLYLFDIIPLLKVKYKNNSIRTYLFDFIPLLKVVCKDCKKKIYLFCFVLLSKFKFKDKKSLDIFFRFGGGIGDLFMSCLYFDKFCKKLTKNIHNMEINAYIQIDQDIQVGELLFKNYKYVKGIFDKSTAHKVNLGDYDLAIELEINFPEIIFLKNINNQFLINYVNSVNKFNYFHDFSDMNAEQQYCSIANKTRITSMDIDNILGIKQDGEINLTIPKEYYSILDRYNLKDRKIITLSRDIDINKRDPESTRLWSVKNYQILIQMIKKTYKDVFFIQLGSNKDRCVQISGIDLNLCGKTTFGELLVLLDVATLHIDCECGKVHIRHFLSRKPSLVLFGPTSIKNKGYDENINLRKTTCNCEFCEWCVGGGWQNFCIRTNSNIPLCMEELEPGYVFNELVKSEILK